MSISLPNSLVELRFQVPTVLLDAACQAIAPYVIDMPDTGSCHSVASRGTYHPVLAASNARFEGVTQKEIRMLLREWKP